MTNTSLGSRSLIPALAFVALLGFAAAACDGGVLSAIGHDGGAGAPGSAGSSGGAGAGAGGGGGVCTTPLGSRMYTDTTAAITDALKGRWIRCGHPLISGESELGLEVGDDLHFWVLVPGPNGGVVRSTSLLESGQVAVSPPGMFNGHLTFNVQFISDANVAYQTQPLFTTDTPRKMFTMNTDIVWQIYVLEDANGGAGGSTAADR